MKAIVEMPRGTKFKYEIGEDEILTLDRPLPVAVPFNYGFIPGTLCDDGDPLDVFIISEEAIPPLTKVTIEIVGVIKGLDHGDRDDKLLAFVFGDYDKPTSYINKITQYLNDYKASFDVLDTQGPVEAAEVLAKAEQDWEKETRRTNKCL